MPPALNVGHRSTRWAIVEVLPEVFPILFVPSLGLQIERGDELGRAGCELPVPPAPSIFPDRRTRPEHIVAIHTHPVPFAICDR